MRIATPVLLLLLLPSLALAAPTGPTPDEARAFIQKVNEDLKRLEVRARRGY